MSIVLRAVIVALVFGFSPLASRAQDPLIRLWTADGELVHLYSLKVVGLTKGTSLELEPGVVVKIEGILGRGSNTLIYDIGNGKALRIPRSDDLQQGGVHIPSFIRFYFDGYRKLEALGAPVVKVHADRSSRERYLVVDKLEVLSTLEEYLGGAGRPPKVEVQLEQFARATWRLAKVGDMHTGQIALTPNGWVIQDYNSDVKEATLIEDLTIFDSMRGLSIFERSRLSAFVRDERAKKTLPNGTMIQCLTRRLLSVGTRLGNL